MKQITSYPSLFAEESDFYYPGFPTQLILTSTQKFSEHYTLDSLKTHLNGEFETSRAKPVYVVYYTDGNKLDKHASVNSLYHEIGEEGIISSTTAPTTNCSKLQVRPALYSGTGYAVEIALSPELKHIYFVAHRDDVFKFYEKFYSEEISKNIQECFKETDWIYISTTNCERTTPSSKGIGIWLLNPIDFPYSFKQYLEDRALPNAKLVKTFNSLDTEKLASLLQIF